MPGGSNYQIDAAHGLYLTNAEDVAFADPWRYARSTRTPGSGAATPTTTARWRSLISPASAATLAQCAGHKRPAPTAGSPDINADNKVNIQDLSITGGNFDKCGAQPWDWCRHSRHYLSLIG